MSVHRWPRGNGGQERAGLTPNTQHNALENDSRLTQAARDSWQDGRGTCRARHRALRRQGQASTLRARGVCMGVGVCGGVWVRV